MKGWGDDCVIAFGSEMTWGEAILVAIGWVIGSSFKSAPVLGAGLVN